MRTQGRGEGGLLWEGEAPSVSAWGHECLFLNPRGEWARGSAA